MVTIIRNRLTIVSLMSWVFIEPFYTFTLNIVSTTTFSHILLIWKVFYYDPETQ